MAVSYRFSIGATIPDLDPSISLHAVLNGDLQPSKTTVLFVSQLKEFSRLLRFTIQKPIALGSAHFQEGSSFAWPSRSVGDQSALENADTLNRYPASQIGEWNPIHRVLTSTFSNPVSTRWILPLLLVLLCTATTFGQKTYMVDSWTTDNGLPENVVNDICQTPDGYLWLATMDGLTRFDGVRFVTFNRSNSPGIEGNRFTHIQCTPRGDLWAATESTGLVRLSHGTFTTFRQQSGLPSDEIHGLVADETHVWALSPGTVVQFDPTVSRFVSLHAPGFTNEAYQMGVQGFWALDNGAICTFHQGKFTTIRLPASWSNASDLTGTETYDGRLVLTDSYGRVLILKDGRWAAGAPLPKWGSAQYQQSILTSFYRDHTGMIWPVQIKPDSAGDRSLLRSLTLPLNGAHHEITFSSILEDHEGSIWLTDNGKGLYRIRKRIISSISTAEGLPDRNIYPVLEDHAGAMWIGTWNGGIARLKGDKIATFSAPSGLLSNRISSIYEDKSGVIWVASSPGIYQMRGDKFYPVTLHSIRENVDIHTFYEDRAGNMLLGTEKGLIKLSHGKFTFPYLKQDTGALDIRVIISDRNGGTWIGGNGGLIHLSNGRARKWTVAEGLPSNNVRALYEDSDGVLWVGTYDGGIARLENGKIIAITERDGLFNDGAFQILEDSNGYLWMSCNHGIYRVLKRELNDFAGGRRQRIDSIHYGAGDGMLNPECNGGLSPAGVRARDGRLWFPTQDGVAVVDPSAIRTNPIPPPVIIESVLLDQNRLDLSRPITIAPGEHNLEIRYTAPSFIDSANLQFKYRLVDLDSDWTQAYDRRTAYFTRLPPGRYSFVVTAANRDSSG